MAFGIALLMAVCFAGFYYGYPWFAVSVIAWAFAMIAVGPLLGTMITVPAIFVIWIITVLALSTKVPLPVNGPQGPYPPPEPRKPWSKRRKWLTGIFLALYFGGPSLFGIIHVWLYG